jgi:hypothetical protein
VNGYSLLNITKKGFDEVVSLSCFGVPLGVVVLDLESPTHRPCFAHLCLPLDPCHYLELAHCLGFDLLLPKLALHPMLVEMLVWRMTIDLAFVGAPRALVGTHLQ